MTLYITDGKGAFAKAKVGFCFAKPAGTLSFKKLRKPPKLAPNDKVLDVSQPFSASFTPCESVAGAAAFFPTLGQNRGEAVIPTVKYERAQIIAAMHETLGVPAPIVSTRDPNFHVIVPKGYTPA